MRSTFGTFIFVAVMLLLDVYVFQAVKTVSQSVSPKMRTIIYIIYWAITFFTIVGFLLYVFASPAFLSKRIKTYLFATIIGLFLAKFTAIIFFLVDDIRRCIQWAASKLFYNNTESEIKTGDTISRSVFLSWLGLSVGTGIFGTLVYGFGNKQHRSNYIYMLDRVAMKTRYELQ